MPFTISIDNVEYLGSEVVITGHVASGAYAGGEYLMIPLVGGKSIKTIEARRYFNNLSGWPIGPEHATEITLHIPWEAGDAVIDSNQPVTGVGSLNNYATRVDVSHALQDPRFWAMHLRDMFPPSMDRSTDYWTQEQEPPETTYFGLPPDALSTYRRDSLNADASKEVTPYIRIPVTSSNYLELEFNAGIEDREQFWIGCSARNVRVLMGYKSRADSLPAFRVEEVVQLVKRGIGTPAFAVLLLTTCYVEDITEELIQLTEKLLSELPGVLRNRTQAMAENLLQHLTILESEWDDTHERGWINKAPLSQRNPGNRLSQLGMADFQFIRDFFSEGAQ